MPPPPASLVHLSTLNFLPPDSKRSNSAHRSPWRSMQSRSMRSLISDGAPCKAFQLDIGSAFHEPNRGFSSAKATLRPEKQTPLPRRRTRRPRPVDEAPYPTALAAEAVHFDLVVARWPPLHKDKSAARGAAKSCEKSREEDIPSFRLSGPLLAVSSWVKGRQNTTWIWNNNCKLRRCGERYPQEMCPFPTME